MTSREGMTGNAGMTDVPIYHAFYIGLDSEKLVSIFLKIDTKYEVSIFLVIG